MTPLMLQIAIGGGGLLLGLLVGALMGGKRLRGSRAAARQTADDLEGQIALKRLRIRELESKLADVQTSDAPLDELPASYQQVLPAQPKDAGWSTHVDDPSPDTSSRRN